MPPNACFAERYTFDFPPPDDALSRQVDANNPHQYEHSLGYNYTEHLESTSSLEPILITFGLQESKCSFSC